jgi:hypothetical protein
MAQAKANLETAKKNLKVLKHVGVPPDKETMEMERLIDKQYATLLKADPDLKN